eukprot:6186411-Pleurochrysis_carterae.AAC.3
MHGSCQPETFPSPARPRDELAITGTPLSAIAPRLNSACPFGACAPCRARLRPALLPVGPSKFAEMAERMRLKQMGQSDEGS